MIFNWASSEITSNKFFNKIFISLFEYENFTSRIFVNKGPPSINSVTKYTEFLVS